MEGMTRTSEAASSNDCFEDVARTGGPQMSFRELTTEEVPVEKGLRMKVMSSIDSNICPTRRLTVKYLEDTEPVCEWSSYKVATRAANMVRVPAKDDTGCVHRLGIATNQPEGLQCGMSMAYCQPVVYVSPPGLNKNGKAKYLDTMDTNDFEDKSRHLEPGNQYAGRDFMPHYTLTRRNAIKHLKALNHQGRLQTPTGKKFWELAAKRHSKMVTGSAVEPAWVRMKGDMGDEPVFNSINTTWHYTLQLPVLANVLIPTQLVEAVKAILAQSGGAAASLNTYIQGTLVFFRLIEDPQLEGWTKPYEKNAEKYTLPEISLVVFLEYWPHVLKQSELWGLLQHWHPLRFAKCHYEADIKRFGELKIYATYDHEGIRRLVQSCCDASTHSPLEWVKVLTASLPGSGIRFPSNTPSDYARPSGFLWDRLMMDDIYTLGSSDYMTPETAYRMVALPTPWAKDRVNVGSPIMPLSNAVHTPQFYGVEGGPSIILVSDPGDTTGHLARRAAEDDITDRVRFTELPMAVTGDQSRVGPVWEEIKTIEFEVPDVMGPEAMESVRPRLSARIGASVPFRNDWTKTNKSRLKVAAHFHLSIERLGIDETMNIYWDTFEEDCKAFFSLRLSVPPGSLEWNQAVLKGAGARFMLKEGTFGKREETTQVISVGQYHVATRTGKGVDSEAWRGEFMARINGLPAAALCWEPVRVVLNGPDSISGRAVLTVIEKAAESLNSILQMVEKIMSGLKSGNPKEISSACRLLPSAYAKLMGIAPDKIPLAPDLSTFARDWTYEDAWKELRAIDADISMDIGLFLGLAKRLRVGDELEEQAEAIMKHDKVWSQCVLMRQLVLAFEIGENLTALQALEVPGMDDADPRKKGGKKRKRDNGEMESVDEATKRFLLRAAGR